MPGRSEIGFSQMEIDAVPPLGGQLHDAVKRRSLNGKDSFCQHGSSCFSSRGREGHTVRIPVLAITHLTDPCQTIKVVRKIEESAMKAAAVSLNALVERLVQERD